ncbi:hypothetical protein MRX96_049248 [Rhipicephalus microplus]
MNPAQTAEPLVHVWIRRIIADQSNGIRRRHHVDARPPPPSPLTVSDICPERREQVWLYRQEGAIEPCPRGGLRPVPEYKCTRLSNRGHRFVAAGRPSGSDTTTRASACEVRFRPRDALVAIRPNEIGRAYCSLAAMQPRLTGSFRIGATIGAGSSRLALVMASHATHARGPLLAQPRAATVNHPRKVRDCRGSRAAPPSMQLHSSVPKCTCAHTRAHKLKYTEDAFAQA